MLAKVQPNALIVDPDRAVGKQYVNAFLKFGIRATVVGTSKQAVRYCKQRGFDILISRVILEEVVTGYELVAKLSKICPIPVLMISNYPLELLRSVRGFDSRLLCLSPFTPEEVAAQADRLLRRSMKQ